MTKLELINRIKNCSYKEHSEQLENYLQEKEHEYNLKKDLIELTSRFDCIWSSKIEEWLYSANLLCKAGFTNELLSFSVEIEKDKNSKYKISISPFDNNFHIHIYCYLKNKDKLGNYLEKRDYNFDEKCLSNFIDKCLSGVSKDTLDTLETDIKFYKEIERCKVMETFEKEWEEFLIEITK